MRYLLASLVATSLISAGASASNDSSIKDLQIDVEFTHCSDPEAGGAPLCGNESWSLQVVSDGWRAEHSNLMQGVPGRWTAVCRDGVYEADMDGRIWPGTCRLTGDQEKLCFDTHSTVVPGDIGGELTQCFKVSGDTCAMDLQGRVWRQGLAGEILNPYLVSARDVTVCRVLGQ